MANYDPDEEEFANEIANEIANGTNVPYKYEPTPAAVTPLAGLPALVAPAAQPVVEPAGIPAALPAAQAAPSEAGALDFANMPGLGFTGGYGLTKPFELTADQNAEMQKNMDANNWYTDLYGGVGGHISKEDVAKVHKQILDQGLTGQWKGQGFGSAEANALDMAKSLVASGVTNINQLGQGTYYNQQVVQERFVGPNGEVVQELGNGQYGIPQYAINGESGANEIVGYTNVPADQLKKQYGYDAIYDNGGEYGSGSAFQALTPEEQKELKTNANGQMYRRVAGGEGIINKTTGERILSNYNERTQGNAFGGTYSGKGNTGYRVQFDAQGNPLFYTTEASSNDLANMLQGNPLLSAVANIAATSFGGPLGSMALQAAQGKDAGDILKAGALSWAGGQAANYIGGSESVIDALGKTGANIAANAAKSFVTSEGRIDPVAALLSAGVDAGVGAIIGNIPGFEGLDKGTQKLVTKAISQTLQTGKLDPVSLAKLAYQAGTTAMANATNVPNEAQINLANVEFLKTLEPYSASTIADQAPADGNTALTRSLTAQDPNTDQLLAAFLNPQDFSGNPSVQVAGTDSAGALEALRDAGEAGRAGGAGSGTFFDSLGRLRIADEGESEEDARAAAESVIEAEVTENVANAVNSQVPTDDGTASVIDDQIAEQAPSDASSVADQFTQPTTIENIQEIVSPTRSIAQPAPVSEKPVTVPTEAAQLSLVGELIKQIESAQPATQTIEQITAPGLPPEVSQAEPVTEQPVEPVKVGELAPEVTPEVQALIDEAVTGQQESAQTQQPTIDQQTQQLLSDLSGETDIGVTPEEITPKAEETPQSFDDFLKTIGIDSTDPDATPSPSNQDILDAIGYTDSDSVKSDGTEVLPGTGDELVPGTVDDRYGGTGDVSGYTDPGTLDNGYGGTDAEVLDDGYGGTEPVTLPGTDDDQAKWDTLVDPEDLDTALTEIMSPEQTDTTSPTEDDVLDFIKEHPEYEDFDKEMLEQIKDVTPAEDDIPEMVVTDKKEPPDYDSFDDDMLRQIEDPIPYEEDEDKKSVTPKLPVTPKTPVKPKTPVTGKKSTTEKTPAVNTDALKTLLAALLANQQQQYLPGIGDVARIKSDESLFGAIPGTSPAQDAQETQYDPVAELLAQGDEEYARGGHVDEFSVEALLQILRS